MFIGISLRTDSIRQQNEEIFNRSLLSHLWIFLYQKTIFFMLYRQRSTFFYETRIKPAEKTISPFRKRTSEPGRTQKTKYAAVSRIPSEVAVGRRVQGSVKRNVFVKPNEQSRACASYAMARKRLLKTNRFAKPSAEPNKVRTMPRWEMDERNSRLFPQSVLRLPTADPSGSPAYRFFHSPIDKTHLHTN